MLFIFFAKLFSLHKDVTWHATSGSECDEIRSVFGDYARIKIAGNLQYKNTSNSLHRIEKKRGILKMFFLSRISQKKNLLFSLEVLSRFKTDAKIEFDIIGPIENKEYWNLCLKEIGVLPRNFTVNYLGPIPSSETSAKISAYHFLFLPTQNENYGHVIMESWMNGKPVIISDQTPWRDLQSKGAGWDISLNKSAEFVNALEIAANMDQEEYNRISASSFQLAQNHILNPEIIDQNRQLFT